MALMFAARETRSFVWPSRGDEQEFLPQSGHWKLRCLIRQISDVIPKILLHRRTRTSQSKLCIRDQPNRARRRSYDGKPDKAQAGKIDCAAILWVSTSCAAGFSTSRRGPCASEIISIATVQSCFSRHFQQYLGVNFKRRGRRNFGSRETARWSPYPGPIAIFSNRGWLPRACSGVRV